MVSADTRDALDGAADHLQRLDLPGNFRDLYRIAFHTLAGLRAGEPFDQAFAHARLDRVPSPMPSTSPVQSALASCAAREPLDFSVWPDHLVRSKEILDHVRMHIARDVRRQSTVDGVSPETRIDVTARALQKWIRLDNTP